MRTEEEIRKYRDKMKEILFGTTNDFLKKNISAFVFHCNMETLSWVLGEAKEKINESMEDLLK